MACQYTVLLTPPAHRRFAWVVLPDKSLYFVQSTGQGMVNILSIKFTLAKYLIFMQCLQSVINSPHGFSLVIDPGASNLMSLLPDYGRTARTLNLILAPALTICLNYNLILTLIEFNGLVKDLMTIPWTDECECYWRNPVLITMPCQSASWPIII